MTSPSDCSLPPDTEVCDDDTCPPKSRAIGGIDYGLGGSVGIGKGLGSPNTFQRNFSDARVRYGNGSIWVNNPYLPLPYGDGGPRGPGGGPHRR